MQGSSKLGTIPDARFDVSYVEVGEQFGLERP